MLPMALLTQTIGHSPLSRHAPLPSMLIWIFAPFSASMKLIEVNWLP